MNKTVLKHLPEVSTSHGVGQKKVLIASSEIPHVTQFAQIVLSSSEIVKAHIHKDMYEIFLIESGEGMMKTNSQEFELHAGICITVEPEEVHEVNNNSDADLVMLTFGIEA